MAHEPGRSIAKPVKSAPNTTEPSYYSTAHEVATSQDASLTAPEAPRCFLEQNWKICDGRGSKKIGMNDGSEMYTPTDKRKCREVNDDFPG